MAAPVAPLRAFRDRADRGFQIQLRGVNVDFFACMHRAKAGNRMRGIRHAKLAAKSSCGHSGLIVCDV
jgi:hypothetical protein